MINLDTSVLVAILQGRERRDERRVLVENAWAISDAVLWEVAVLERDRRIRPLLNTRDLEDLLNNATVYAVDLHIARTMRRLDFQSDPADEIIAATSLAYDIPLLTRDARLLGSKVVPLALRD